MFVQHHSCCCDSVTYDINVFVMLKASFHGQLGGRAVLSDLRWYTRLA